ncbi:sensor histidine kinase [Tenacibaculum xiamenense]|uniref:sensor histidine kinase n=1 Tax=Tenacibaculum xiamenense TaxID=1261553 RepID=UPI003894EF21
MIWRFLKDAGKLEAFEIKNNSIVLSLLGPGVYIYSLLIYHFNPSLVEVPYAREFFTILFLGVGLSPMIKNKFVLEYYGLLTFLTMFVFEHYLIYMMALNNFSLDYLLGAYIATFGGVLMLSNRWLIVLFSTFQLLHMAYQVETNNVDLVTEGAILISITTIFVFSFIILNGAMQYRKGLEQVNSQLESKIKERTKDLEKRAKELYERNKDLEEFAYVVSHDLKRPLRNIHTLAEWVTSKELLEENCVEEDSEMHENLFIIKEQVTQMDMLINGILNYSLQMEKEKGMNKVNVDSLVRRIIMVNSSENCTIEIKNKLPEVYFNESQLLQVFQNLIQNAIKHNDKDNVHIDIDVKEGVNDYVFSISDNGPGIEEKYHQKIFQLFQKLELQAHVDSIGIGLALVKKIIERNDGKVWLESKKGEGTTFFFMVAKP